MMSGFDIGGILANDKRRLKKWLLLPLMASLMAFLGGAAGGQAAAGFYTAEGRRLSLEETAEKLRGYDVIVFGEFHDNKESHAAEMALLESFYQKERDLALSLEMIERDAQPLLDAYLSGELAESEFLAQSRPWENYREDYRPLVEFAKERRMDVIAGNIPRYLAAQYAKAGSLDTVAADQKQYLPQRHRVWKGAYYQKFKEYMKSGQTGMALDEAKLERFYRAQCLKDDTMAESIAFYRQLHPQRKVFHVQGNFHGAGRLGVVEKLQALEPDLKIAVISSVYGDVRWHGKDGDFLLQVRKTPE